MASLSLERSLNMAKACNKIISFIPGIHFVSVINKNDRMIKIGDEIA